MATYYTKWAFSGTSSPNSETYTIDGVRVTYYNDVRWRFVVSEAIDSVNNTSIFTVKKYAVFLWNWTTNSQTLNISARSRIPNTASYQTNSATVTSSTSSSGYKLIGTDTFTVPHNAEGKGNTTFNGNGYYTGGSGTTYSRSASGTIKMTAINRVSSITSNATPSTEFGNNITFSISRYNSNFTHDISYSMYGANGTIATGVGTSQSWTIPTSLIASTPDNANPIITITCVTKNGSTTIGSTTYSFKCKVPDSYVPTCSLSLEDIGDVPDGWNVWVKGKSIAKGTITATGSESSTIKSYISKANDEIYQVNPFTTNYLKNNGERIAITTITDSRGRTATASQTINVVDYFLPTIVMCKIERCNADGTLNEEGTYGKATIQYKISPVNNGTTNLNIKTVKVAYGSIEKIATLNDYEGTYTYTELFSGLETNTTYNFEFILMDSFEAIFQTYTLPPAYVTISKLAGGKGVTFGQVATEEGLISHMNTKLYKNNWVKNISIDGLKTEKYQGGWIVYADDEA